MQISCLLFLFCYVEYVITNKKWVEEDTCTYWNSHDVLTSGYSCYLHTLCIKHIIWQVPSWPEWPSAWSVLLILHCPERSHLCRWFNYLFVLYWEVLCQTYNLIPSLRHTFIPCIYLPCIYLLIFEFMLFWYLWHCFSYFVLWGEAYLRTIG